jgi:hypothetical protein
MTRRRATISAQPAPVTPGNPTVIQVKRRFISLADVKPLSRRPRPRGLHTKENAIDGHGATAAGAATVG